MSIIQIVSLIKTNWSDLITVKVAPSKIFQNLQITVNSTNEN